MLPANILLVRHGESEGNIAFRAEREGDTQFILNEEFSRQHSSRWRLTNTGREQAKATGEWINENYPDGFDYYFTSEYARAIETAGLLGIKETLGNPTWRISPYLRERNWGELDRLPEEERQALYASSLRDKEITPYYWRPPNGESLVDVSARLRLLIDTFHRIGDANPDRDVKIIVVCHGEVIEALQIELERLTEHDYLEVKNDPTQKVHNCTMIDYVQRDPVSGDRNPYMSHKRLINVTGNPRVNEPIAEYQPIVRRSYSSDDLLKIVERSPNFFQS